MWWPFGRAYETRMLNRDARVVLEDARARFRDERLQEMAELVRAHLGEAHRRLDPPRVQIANLLPEYRRLHRDARRRHQDMPLSALTLVIIYLRGEALGEGCEPALEVIEAFLAERGVLDAPGPGGRIEA